MTGRDSSPSETFETDSMTDEELSPKHTPRQKSIRKKSKKISPVKKTYLDRFRSRKAEDRICYSCDNSLDQPEGSKSSSEDSWGDDTSEFVDFRKTSVSSTQFQ